jgi:PIN domain nuclease of toxin-antitoxin system
MKYLLDTVAVIRYFSGIGKIGKKAKAIFDMKTENENRLVISVVSLMEILYLSEKSRIPINLKETLKQMKISPIYMVADLTSEVIQVAETVDFDELHDRLILATAKWLDIPVISSDSRFHSVKDIQVIWD